MCFCKRLSVLRAFAASREGQQLRFRAKVRGDEVSALEYFGLG